MLLGLVAKIFGNKNDRELKKMLPAVQRINDLEPKFKELTDEALKAKTDEFKERLAQGESLDDLLPEAFATVREASWRSLGMRHFDCQLLGGMVLHNGAIAEMKTGEGKTLTATLPLYLNALTGKGVWLVTVNDYLAKRDAEWMGRLYNYLGLSVGTILHEKNDQERRDAYRCDITYGTNNEFGFDYLRDNMKFNKINMGQRGFYYAIVDEVDSVLVDEARTPLIISGPAEESTGKYYEADSVVRKLTREAHYTVDEKDHHALFTEDGMQKAEELLRVENLYDPGNIETLHCMEQSLKAHFLFKRDVDYLVRENQVIIIDQHTGRQMPGRRYSDGLHQALEAKEGVKIEKQNQTLASVTFQNFFRMFDKLSGMTGTAETEAAEFMNIYKLEVYVIPTNKPMVRDDVNDQIYGVTREKFDAILDEIERQNKIGRPVLVGTIAIETSEFLSELLKKRGVKHIVLNAKYHESEAEIVAQAGRLGAVTIATNMAGRGTDILLGGNPENLTEKELAANPDADASRLLEANKAMCAEEKKKVLELGGLCIIGTERHESRRIDNQLRGRSGRQGDPGSSCFYLSLEDKLMRLFGSPRMKNILARNMEEGVAIEHRMVNRAIERAQKAVETRNFEVRKHLLDYDDVMNKQRTTFYRMRREMMESNPRDFLFRRVEAILDFAFAELDDDEGGDDAKRRLTDTLKSLFLFDLGDREIDLENLDALKQEALEAVRERYQAKWDALEAPPETIEEHERFIMLYVVDQQWKDHMRNMDSLKEGISLQGYAQKDPLIEYKKASYEMFNNLMDRMDEEVVKMLVFLQPRVGNDEALSKMRRRRASEARAMRLAGKEDREGKAKTFRRDQPKIGRNDPCYCGSGKKFKQCHGRR